jgi:hypothetical protein
MIKPEKKHKKPEFNLERYQRLLGGETIYEATGLCIKKLDSFIHIYFDDPTERKLMYLRCENNTALEMSKRIIAALEGE